MSQSSKLHVLRGPLLVFAALLSVVWPYLSPQVLVCAAAVSAGVAMFVVDVMALGENALRTNLAAFLDGLVLDDLLRAIYDPETGVVATTWMAWVANSMGCISMYSMKMNEDQRTELFQAGCQIERDAARTILLERGGIKWLIDDRLREWLYHRPSRIPPLLEPQENESRTKKNVIEVETVEIEGVESETMESGSEASEVDCGRGLGGREDFSSVKGLDDDDHHHYHHTPSRTSRRHMDASSRDPMHMPRPREVPPDPVKTLQNIVVTICRDQLKSYLRSIPESSVERVASAATSFLFAQICWKATFRSKMTFWKAIVPALTVGALTGSVGTLLARDAADGKLQGINSARAMGKMILSKLLQQVKPGTMRRILAFFVLVSVGKHRARRKPETKLTVRPMSVSSPMLHK